jgi:hypothetical protein
MQKLKLKSIYKFRISCSSSHIEHSKIDFAIFGFFYDFTWILQDSDTTQRKRRIFFHNHPWKDLNFSTIPSVCAKAPGKCSGLAMWPPGLGGGAARGNPGDLAGGLGRGVAGEALGVAGDRFGCSLWRKQCRRAGTAAATVGGDCSCELRLGLSNK